MVAVFRTVGNEFFGGIGAVGRVSRPVYRGCLRFVCVELTKREIFESQQDSVVSWEKTGQETRPTIRAHSYGV
jgi:hypothetical protein